MEKNMYMRVVPPEETGYVIMVPNKVFRIDSAFPYGRIAEVMNVWIKKISETHRIVSALPLTEKLNDGSITTTIYFFVEPHLKFLE